MSVLTQKQIKELGILKPCFERNRSLKSGIRVPSYGLGYMGYDLRMDAKLRVFTKQSEDRIAEIDPMNPVGLSWNDVVLEEGDYYAIAPQETILAVSMEYINMPSNVIGIALGKSTLARLGILCNTTPLEPGWRGHLTIEITNLSTTHAVKLYAGMGICQVVFFQADEEDGHEYEGPYQNQTNAPFIIPPSLN